MWFEHVLRVKLKFSCRGVIYGGSALKPPQISAEINDLLLFWGVFCDFFKSYGSEPLTLIMFFVVLWEVVSPLRAIFDIMTQNRENRKKRVQKWPYFSPFEALLKVKYSENQGDDFVWFFKVVLMVLEFYPRYGKVSLGLKESISSLRIHFSTHKIQIKPPCFESSIFRISLKNMSIAQLFHLVLDTYRVVLFL